MADDRREGREAEEEEPGADEPGEEELRERDADRHVHDSGGKIERELTPAGRERLS